LPPTKKEATAKKPNWGKVEQARAQMLKMMEAHQRGISHPWYFEQYMGLPHVFDKPEELTQLEEKRAVAQKADTNVLSMLDRLEAKHGNVDIRELA
jgi:hypothetical protein